MNAVPAGSPRIERLLRVLKRTAIVLLLLAIPTLSTLAKQSWYLPQADTGHYLNGAIKMKVSHTPLIADREPPLAMAKTFPPRVHSRVFAQARPIFVPSITIVPVPPYRPPPFAVL